MCEGIHVESSQVEFLDLSQANHFGNICEELFSLIKNEKLWDRRRSDTVGPGVVQISVVS